MSDLQSAWAMRVDESQLFVVEPVSAFNLLGCPLAAMKLWVGCLARREPSN